MINLSSFDSENSSHIHFYFEKNESWNFLPKSKDTTQSEVSSEMECN